MRLGFKYMDVYVHKGVFFFFSFFFFFDIYEFLGGIAWLGDKQRYPAGQRNLPTSNPDVCDKHSPPTNSYYEAKLPPHRTILHLCLPPLGI